MGDKLDDLLSGNQDPNGPNPNPIQIPMNQDTRGNSRADSYGDVRSQTNPTPNPWFSHAAQDVAQNNPGLVNLLNGALTGANHASDALDKLNEASTEPEEPTGSTGPMGLSKEHAQQAFSALSGMLGDQNGDQSGDNSDGNMLQQMLSGVDVGSLLGGLGGDNSGDSNNNNNNNNNNAPSATDLEQLKQLLQAYGAAQQNNNPTANNNHNNNNNNNHGHYGGFGQNNGRWPRSTIKPASRAGTNNAADNQNAALMAAQMKLLQDMMTQQLKKPTQGPQSNHVGDNQQADDEQDSNKGLESWVIILIIVASLAIGCLAACVIVKTILVQNAVKEVNKYDGVNPAPLEMA